MSKNRREVIIEDTRNGAKFSGFLKKAYFNSSIIHYQVFLISNIFDGSKCENSAKENFYYSWILTSKAKTKIINMDLDKITSFNQDDWDYSFPPDVIGSRNVEIGVEQIYKIYFKKKTIFKEIKI